jgi:heme-degrading monooxygenase HmoA
MLRAILYMKVKSDRVDEFIQAWRKVAAYVQHMPGNLHQALLRDPQDDAGFIISSDWESKEAFHAFERSSEQDMLTASLRDMRLSARMETYDVIELFQKGEVS